MRDFLNTTAGLYALQLYTGLYQMGHPEAEDNDYPPAPD
jgi:hypothetical protein